MSADTVDAGVREILETALGELLAANENPSREQFGQWDSLTYLEIVFMLEERFDVRFSEDEIKELSSLRGIVSVLQAKQAA